MGGRGCAARGHGYGPCVAASSAAYYPPRWSRRVSLSGPKKLGRLAGGGCGWGRGPLAVVGVEVPAVGAVGGAVCGS